MIVWRYKAKNKNRPLPLINGPGLIISTVDKFFLFSEHIQKLSTLPYLAHTSHKQSFWVNGLQ